MTRHETAFAQMIRGVSLGILLELGFTGCAIGEPTNAMTAQSSNLSIPADDLPPLPAQSNGTLIQQQLMQMDLSIWGMYQRADPIVKTVMIVLFLTSIVTWALFFSKGVELIKAKRRLLRELGALKEVRSLNQATLVAANFPAYSLSANFLEETANEIDLSGLISHNNGIKERVGFRLERCVANASRDIVKGNGFLATICAISPFIGLFGTVWGIMNSFIGIAHTQNTNLAVVAPGIAEALLATALSLFVAIPAVIIYNIFARTISNYKAMVGDCAAILLLLVSRDLDLKTVTIIGDEVSG
ncbi:MAG: Tol-Pal system protein TolQ [Sodalis sp. Fse]|nr:MAG: Tol-Pal system protein TolQ [Sodalis sp. Fse]